MGKETRVKKDMDNDPVVADNRAVVLSDSAKNLMQLCEGLRGVITTASIDTVARIYHGLDKIEKASEDLRKEARARLLGDLACADSKGTAVVDSKGHITVHLSDWTVQRICRKSRLPDEEGLRQLLVEKKIPEDQAFSEKTTAVVDPEKLSYLTEGGHLTSEEIAALQRETYSIRVVAED